MLKQARKIIAVSLIVLLNWTGVSAVVHTRAYFSDTEISPESVFEAGILDLTARSGQGNFVPGPENMTPGKQVNRDIYIGEAAFGLPLRHNASFEFTSGNTGFCDQLDLKIWYNHYHGEKSGGYANRDMRLAYSGKLSSLSVFSNDDFLIPHFDDLFDDNPSDGTEQWFYYSITMPSGIAEIFQGEACNFNFVFNAWQDNFDYLSGGFTDIEKLGSVIKAGYWNPPVVLNEFLPNAGDYFEFVELYNRTSSPIDLEGFYIKANNNTIPINAETTREYSGGSTMIPANGWLVAAAGGNLINDSSGTISLYNRNSVLVDLYAYGSPDHNINNTPGKTNNLAGYWPFDGDLKDKSGNENNGTGDTVFVDGKINQALSFAGTSNYVEIADSGALKPASVTLEAWVRATSPGSYKYIAGQSYDGDHASYALYTASSGGLRFYIGHERGYTLSPDAGKGVWDGTWRHIVGTFDGSYVRLFVDGAEIGGGTSAAKGIAYNVNEFYIGKGSHPTSYYFNGSIDEVKVYGRALGTAEISEHYNDAYISSGLVPLDKSYARIPDGFGDWIDPVPTPGMANKLDDYPAMKQAEELAELVELAEEPAEEPISGGVEEPSAGEEADAGGEIVDEPADEAIEELTEKPAEEMAGEIIGGITEEEMIEEIIEAVEEPATEEVAAEEAFEEEIIAVSGDAEVDAAEPEINPEEGIISEQEAILEETSGDLPDSAQHSENEQ